MTVLFQVENLTKVFGRLEAVSNVSLSVKKGEIVGIIGPNGAGKTTFFNLITGFLLPTRGSVKFKGQEVSGKQPHRIVKLGMTRTFQVPRPLKEMTVLDNVLIANPRQEGVLGDLDAEEILHRVGLLEKKEQGAGNLPQGDLRRLEVARALSTNPDLLLLDEPYAGLGPKEMDGLTSLLHELHSQGLTIIIIEHKLRELMKLIKRAVVLNFGQKLIEGLPQEVVRDEMVLEAYLGKKGVS